VLVPSGAAELAQKFPCRFEKLTDGTHPEPSTDYEPGPGRREEHGVRHRPLYGVRERALPLPARSAACRHGCSIGRRCGCSPWCLRGHLGRTCACPADPAAIPEARQDSRGSRAGGVGSGMQGRPVGGAAPPGAQRRLQRCEPLLSFCQVASASCLCSCPPALRLRCHRTPSLSRGAARLLSASPREAAPPPRRLHRAVCSAAIMYSEQV